MDITWTGTLENAEIRIYSGDGTTGSFYCDDTTLLKRQSQVLTNEGFENGTTGWTGGACTISTVTSPVRSGNNALSITGRSDQFAGNRQSVFNTLTANGQGKYNVGAWLKTAAGSFNGRIEVWIQYNGGQQQWFDVSSVLLNSYTWTNVAGDLDITWTGTLENAEMRIFSGDGTTGSFYCDDAYLTPLGLISPQLMVNQGYENGTTGWTGGACTISTVTSPVRSGTYALSITGRSDQFAGNRQSVFNTLYSNGQGTYNVGSWLKTVSGTFHGAIEVWIQYDGGQQQWFEISSVLLNSTDWTNVAGDLNITWTGMIENAEMRIFSGDGTTGSFYCDDATFKIVK